jgi:hypothetical protein
MAPEGLPHYDTAEWLSLLDDAAIDALVNAAAAGPTQRSMIVLKRMGGAAARVPARETAFWYRQAPHKLNVHVEWVPGEPDAHREWVRSTREAVSRASPGAGGSG